MKIDSHQHFWKYKQEEYAWISDQMNLLKRDHLPAELFSILTNAGYDGSIAVQARQSLKETDWLLKLASENDFIKAVVGWVNLFSENIDEQLSNYKLNRKFVGIRHVLQDEPDDDFMLGAGFCKGIKTLAKYDLTYDLLIFPKHLKIATKLVQQFPVQKFILDHAGKPCIKERAFEPWKNEITILARNPNVFCKLSGMVTEADWQNWKPADFVPYLDILFESFGPSRLMIGSDWPVCTIAGDYSHVMNLVENYISNLSATEKKAILGENAVSIYRLH